MYYVLCGLEHLTASMPMSQQSWVQSQQHTSTQWEAADDAGLKNVPKNKIKNPSI
jgi:hypothetical protein